MSNTSDGPNGLLLFCYGAFYVAQFVTYVMAAVRWFGTPYGTFWLGFKEMIWALVPIANFGYVWDWWAAAFLFVVALADRL